MSKSISTLGILSFFILNSFYCVGQNANYLPKLLVLADYFEDIPINSDSCIDLSHLSCDTLNTVGFYNVYFFKVTYRDIKSLQYYFQTNVLRKENGGIFNFSYKEYKSFFQEQYDTNNINNIPFYEDEIGKNYFINNQIEYQCDFIISYETLTGRYFKLKGFKVNEFNDFFNYVLKNNLYLSPIIFEEISNFKGRKRDEKLLKQLFISELNLEELYKVYYTKRKIKDSNSCYYRDKLRIKN